MSNLTHTALGQPKAWTWFSGDTASRTFDNDGRATGSEIATLGYDAAGRITSVTQKLWMQQTGRGGGTSLVQHPITWTAGYDQRDRLTSFARAGAGSTFTYDANSNRLTAVETQGSEVDLEGSFDQPGLDANKQPDAQRRRRQQPPARLQPSADRHA